MVFKKNILRSWYFWITLLLISVVSSYFSWEYFPRINVILNVPIAIDKSQAEKLSRDLCTKYKLGPQNYFQISYFAIDKNIEEYIQKNLFPLNDKENFTIYTQNNLYQLYTWQVRHLKEGNINECLLKFTPSGVPYGFIEQISETEMGPALSFEEALDVARNFTNNDWHINLENYNLIESSYQERLSGRIDYTFIFEPILNHLINDTPSKLTSTSSQNILLVPLLLINALKARLIICVYGDKVTVLDHFLEIHPSNSKNFQEYTTGEFNAFNESLNSFTTMIAYFFYLILCCIGLIILIKKNYLIKNVALFYGIVLALAQFIFQLSALSDIWLNYNPSQLAGAHLVNNILGYIIGILFYSALYALVFMIAEGLTRAAFPRHIQLWKSFNKEVSSSYSLLGIVLSSYLLATIYLGFMIALSLYSAQLFCWSYIPLVTIDPTILGHYYPAFTALTKSLSDSIWKEVLFRAVPIGCFTLIGQRIGSRKIGIIIGFIAQIFIIAIANSSYLTLSNAIRFIEPIISSIFFGILYINFGLLSGIIIQFVYNSFLNGITLFKASSSALFIQKLLLLGGIVIPLIIILINIVRNRKITELPEYYLNKAWLPTLNKYQEIPEIPTRSFTLSVSNIISLGILTLLSGIILYKTTDVIPHKPHFIITRDGAIAKAKDFLQSKKVVLNSDWEILSKIITPKRSIIKYIWQNFGEEIYQKLNGSYIEYPVFEITFTKFEKLHCLRSEEYIIRIDSSGTIESGQHILPEEAPGKSLSETVANHLAISVSSEQFKLDPALLKIVSSIETKRPARKDWIITLQDTSVTFIGDSQAQIILKIYGDEITSINRKIKTPKEWSIHKSKFDQFSIIFDLLNELVLFLIILIAFFQSLQTAKSRSVLIKSVLIWLGYLSLIIADILLSIPEITAHLNTAKSFYFQIMYTEFITIAKAVMKSLTILILATTIFTKKNQSQKHLKSFSLIAINLGLIASGLTAALFLLYKNMPITYSLQCLNTYNATAFFVINNLILFISRTFIILFIAQYAKFAFSFRTIFSVTAITLLIGSSLEMKDLYSHLMIFIVIFIIILLAHLTIIRYNNLLIPVILLSIQISQLLQEYRAEPFIYSKDIILITILTLTAIALLIILLIQRTTIKNNTIGFDILDKLK